MQKKVFCHKGPLHERPESISFSLYSTEEIRKLSVVQVMTPIAFNSLGHPLPGGLYDPLMGPFQLMGSCKTCQQNLTFCPGHFGHIELPLPVLNPMFNKTMLHLLRMSCFGCNALLIPGIEKYLLIAQLKLLRLGYIQEALEAELVGETIDSNTTEKKSRSKMSSCLDELARQKFDDYVQNVLATRENCDKGYASRNAEQVIQSVVKRVSSFAKINQRCSTCRTKTNRIIIQDSKIIYSMEGSLGAYSITKIESVDENEEKMLEELLGGVLPSDDQSQFIERRGGLSKMEPRYMTALEAKDHLRRTWIKESYFLSEFFPVLSNRNMEYPTDLFFLEIIAVPPPKNRPTNMLNGLMVENPLNVGLKYVVSTSLVMRYILQASRKGLDTLDKQAQLTVNGVQGADLRAKLGNIWKELQADVDHILDRERNKISAAQSAQIIGLKQVIEKKEGLFRMNMMGKRVNFAARTVITPDPLIHIEEIGIPEEFARVLTFPTKVTHWNYHFLKSLVENGPDVHPGAIAVETDSGQIIKLDPKNEEQRIGVAGRLLVADKFNQKKSIGKTVYRHLMNGDYLLLNRQPSLHRPSIMAHRARVLYGEKVFRLHYANCKHYNADFDGDEMNAHFPQNHVARSEAAHLVNVTSHFLTPKDGTPLGGLIQDHVVAAVKMTMRGRFFTCSDYQRLVYFALSNWTSVIKIEPPAMLKPHVLWSGKQVISTVIRNLIPEGRDPFTFNTTAKIKHEEWRQVTEYTPKAGGSLSKGDLSESTVIFLRGHLICGIIDKIQLGATPYGLCHAFSELYGKEAIGNLITAFSRLFTNFLQWQGFTLGIKDVLVRDKANQVRHIHCEQSTKIGLRAASEGVELNLKDMDMDSPEYEKILIEKLEAVHRSRNPKRRAMVDRAYKDVLDDYNNKINKSCIPFGLVDIFPENNLQLLVLSGAKGSTVNTMQISGLLGQIELEGKRPPLMISGKSLPSFKSYDLTPKAGGFISARFLTGIRPQEFFFHCMAGREGLIDTAVKTSRCGYLQRCLVKLLEGVTVNYDMTVRDSDGSVIQFLYGEDGLDVCKSQYLKEKHMNFLATNWKSITDEKHLSLIKTFGDQKKIAKSKKKFKKWMKANDVRDKERISPFLKFCRDNNENELGQPGWNEETGRSHYAEAITKAWNLLSPGVKNVYKVEKCPDPINSKFSSSSNFGVVPEKIEQLMKETKVVDEKRFQDTIYSKVLSAVCPPGESVGVIAAQSIGEPSTQMTLNTFHFAGRGEMNVTLGIPRLREILMVASANIKTPMMEIPFRPNVLNKKAEWLRKQLTRVTMSQVLHEVDITERIDVSTQSRIYSLDFTFLPKVEYEEDFCLNPKSVLRYFETVFISKSLLSELRKQGNMKKGPKVHATAKDYRDKNRIDFDDENDEEVGSKNDPTTYKKVSAEGHESSDEDEVAEDADATQANRQARHTEAEYEEPEEIEEGEGVEKQNTDSNENENEDDETDNPEKDLSQLFGNEDTTLNQKFEDVLAKNEKGYDRRVASVLAQDPFIVSYSFDEKKSLWAKLEIQLKLSVEKINMGTILRTAAERSVIHQVTNISRAFIVKVGDRPVLKTEGINIGAVTMHRETLDLNKFYCNNIHTMANFYGIESAGRVMVKEMNDVFKAYGITVDKRHLTLIADFMTFSGSYRPFNRFGITSSVSPLQQMSFETIMNFLREATLAGKTDTLDSPSAQLVVGKPTKIGTGVFECLNKI